MVKANRQLLFKVLSDAWHQGDHLANIFSMPFIRKHVKIPLSGYLQRRLSQNIFTDQDLLELAKYLSATFDSLDALGQNLFVADLKLLNPQYPWAEAFTSVESTGQPVMDKSDFDASAGPDLIPKVTTDRLQDLLIDVSFLRSHETFSEDQSRQWIHQVLDEVADSADKRRTTYWSMRLFSELRQHSAQIAGQVSAFSQFAVGFLNPQTERDAFGVIALTLSDDPPDPQFLASIEIDGIDFPVVVRPIALIEHALPALHPANGTAACWAMSRKSAPKPQLGILTAKHVAGKGVRKKRRVDFCGNAGYVIDLAPEGIDAVLIDTPESFSQRWMKPMASLVHVAQWTDVEFVGATSGTIVTRVTATTDLLGIYNSPLIPLRVLLAHHGTYGDSGALVVSREQARKPKAVGLYIGGGNDPAKQPDGVAQYMEQIVETMDMELYQ